MQNERTAAESPNGEEVVPTTKPTSPTTSEASTTSPPFGRDVDGKPFIKCFAVGCAYTSTWRQNIRLHARRCHPDQWRFRPPGWSSPTGRTRAGRRRDEVLSELRAFADRPPSPAPTTEPEPTAEELERILASIHPDFAKYETPPPSETDDEEDSA